MSSSLHTDTTMINTGSQNNRISSSLNDNNLMTNMDIDNRVGSSNRRITKSARVKPIFTNIGDKIDYLNNLEEEDYYYVD